MTRACDRCESLARVKEAGARMAAAGGKRSGISMTISTSRGSITLTHADAARLRGEAATIRTDCLRGRHAKLPDQVGETGERRDAER
jgi:hypothetical protein